MWNTTLNKRKYSNLSGMMLLGHYLKANFLGKNKYKICFKGNLIHINRILYVWHMRHPSSGYVQGLNDIVTPFIIVFLSDFIQIDFEKVRAL